VAHRSLPELRAFHSTQSHRDRRLVRLCARSLEFFEKHSYIEWLRLPGDAVFIAGVVPLVVLTARAVLRPSAARARLDPSGAAVHEPLFTDETEV